MSVVCVSGHFGGKARLKPRLGCRHACDGEGHLVGAGGIDCLADHLAGKCRRELQARGLHFERALHGDVADANVDRLIVGPHLESLVHAFFGARHDAHLEAERPSRFQGYSWRRLVRRLALALALAINELVEGREASLAVLPHRRAGLVNQLHHSNRDARAFCRHALQLPYVDRHGVWVGEVQAQHPLVLDSDHAHVHQEWRQGLGKRRIIRGKGRIIVTAAARNSLQHRAGNVQASVIDAQRYCENAHVRVDDEGATRERGIAQAQAPS